MTYISYEKLKIKMVQQRIEFKDFAVAFKFSSHTITKFKRNEPVSYEVISKLCNFFQCNMSELMDVIYYDENAPMKI